MKRYERPLEDERYLSAATYPAFEYAALATALDESELSPGGKALVLAIVRNAAIAEFPGGLGLDYASLLKTAVRPEDIGPHIEEASRHLHEMKVDLLFVPGMSGYPLGAVYSIASGIPAILLKKTALAAEAQYPLGAFVVPSYTGDGDFVMSADPAAVQELVDRIATRQLSRQRDRQLQHLHVRLGGADDIIDKGTMSVAVGESALEIVEAALARFVVNRGLQQVGTAPVSTKVEMVAWVTPLMKGYNRPNQLLLDRFGFEPFAGVVVEGVSRDPEALTISGLGSVKLERNSEANFSG